MFSSTGLFKSIPCPEGEKCVIIHCIFSHELRPKAVGAEATLPAVHAATEGPEPKRRRLDGISITAGPNRTPALFPALPTLSNGSYKGPTTLLTATQAEKVQQRLQITTPRTLQTKVTPPPLQNGPKSKPVPTALPGPAKTAVKETLNPRRIPHDPAGHAKRTLFLKYIHAEMKRLNTEVQKGSHKDKDALLLTDEEMIKAALDEEEQIARGNSNVYPNIIKNRITALKKMKVDDWIKHVLKTFVKAKIPDEPVAQPESLDTGLPLDYERLFLDHMISDQVSLAKHGYVTIPPSQEDIVEAEAAVAASLNHEVCDRCKSRFRVFPDRREEDGALTTNGPCVYHWARPLYPKRERTDAIKGARETVHGCCLELLGSKGCTEVDTHVFKINDPKRLASVLPFVNTPENPNPAKGPNGKVPAALTFDCEMGYTVRGFELMRLTAVTWPEGDAIIDVLVRPQGAILDFNTRFSGISPEAYNTALPYGVARDMDALLPPPPPGSETRPEAFSKGGPMAIVDSPAAARDLLCSYITPHTPLIGHALENDLNVVRLCHPRIIDTVVLFPHPKGLPIRFGLKVLTKQRLNRDIQMGGANGHDSLEDARATGELVRFAVKQRWGEMKIEGWHIKNGNLSPPLPRDMPPPPTEGDDAKVLGGGAGLKRQRIQAPGVHNSEGSTKKHKS